jgi:hypothetical protein
MQTIEDYRSMCGVSWEVHDTHVDSARNTSNSQYGAVLVPERNCQLARRTLKFENTQVSTSMSEGGVLTNRPTPRDMD